MNFLSLISIEVKKIRRSKILAILAIAVVLLWLPSIFHADINFQMQAEGIAPENNFLVQGFLGMAWFMFPASMVVSTVLLNMTERNNNGILKMLSLPISTVKLCLVKFIILFMLAAIEMLMTVAMYFISAGIASQMQNYNFLLKPLFVLKEAGMILTASIPMLAFFWLLSVCIRTPIFSIGIGLASIVPSVLMINTKLWFVYPMAYPFYIITAEYGKLAAHLSEVPVKLVPWLPVAISITIICLFISCFCFGRAERR